MYDDEQLEALRRLVERALARWDLPGDTRVAVLAVSENATFLLSLPDGQRRVLRVARPGYHNLAEIRSELAWSEAVRRDAGVRCPAVIAGVDGDMVQRLAGRLLERRAILFEHVAGVAPSETAEAFALVGQVTARLHAHARGWTRLAEFVRKAWTVETAIGAVPHWGGWRGAAGLDAAGEAVLARAAEAVARQLGEYGRRAERFGLIHADLRVANLLAAENELAVIDFDDCGLGWFAADFAASVSFIEHSEAVPSLFEAWCRGYGTVAAADRAVMGALLVMRRMQLLGWTRTHAETATVRALGTDFAAQTVGLAERFLSGRDLLDGRAGRDRGYVRGGHRARS